MTTDYSNIATPILVDLLAQETEKFTHLMSQKEQTPEYDEQKQIILQIQAVIKSRNETTITDPDLSFTPPDSTA